MVRVTRQSQLIPRIKFLWVAVFAHAVPLWVIRYDNYDIPHAS